jgi:hypothetical protein
MADDLITQIVQGTSPSARRSLLNLLIEAENIWANFDVVCHEPQRCQKALSLSHLFALRREIEASLAPQRTEHAEARDNQRRENRSS